MKPRLLLPVIIVLAATLLAGCGHRRPRPCSRSSQSSLPGVSIEILGQCRFTLAEARRGLEIPYQIVITDDVPAEAHQEGGCDQPGPGGLILTARLAGAHHSYCDCDRGGCPPTVPPPLVDLRPGIYRSVFTWDGLEWNGPSDTDPPPRRRPFPAGAYTLTLSGVGYLGPPPKPYAVDHSIRFAVSAVADIELVP